MHWMISRSYDKTRTTFHHATCRQATFYRLHRRNHHCHHHLRRRHLRAQTALFGTTCVLLREDSNLQPSGWNVPPLPLHQHIADTWYTYIRHYMLEHNITSIHNAIDHTHLPLFHKLSCLGSLTHTQAMELIYGKVKVITIQYIYTRVNYIRTIIQDNERHVFNLRSNWLRERIEWNGNDVSFSIERQRQRQRDVAIFKTSFVAIDNC